MLGQDCLVLESSVVALVDILELYSGFTKKFIFLRNEWQDTGRLSVWSWSIDSERESLN